MNEQTDFASQLGALTAEIHSLGKRLDRDREDKRHVDEDAAEQRVAVQRELNALKEAHRDVHRKTDDLVRRVDEIEPVARMVSSWQMRWTGAVIVFGLLGTVATAGWVFFKTQIIQLFTGDSR